jgi:hypothetical protein
MLLTRQEMTFDFHGARFDPQADRDILAFIFDQFLYGEVTGIQVGHWFYNAPDFEAAAFLAKQAAEEMGHVHSFLEIFRMLGARPLPPHPVVRFLATGFIGGSFPEHTCLEMALGEGFVLYVLYALIDTLDHPGIVRVLEAACIQEERHVAFGEDQTAEAVRADPRLKGHLLALSLVSLKAVRRFGPQIRRLAPQHPIIARMPEFLQGAVHAAELRLLRMGVIDRPLAQVEGPAMDLRVAAALLRRYGRAVVPRRPRKLTRSYLEDPLLDRFGLRGEIPPSGSSGSDRRSGSPPGRNAARSRG